MANKNNNKIGPKDLERAIIFATEAHKGQTRKGDGKPYIVHPLEVMFILSNIKKSNNFYLLAIVCILHDSVEDTDVTLKQIEQEFGYQVASLVDELTSDKDQIALHGKMQYLANKMFHMSSYALRIKLADRLHNLRTSDTMSAEFRVKYKNETTYILEDLKDRKLTKTHLKLIKLINIELKNMK